MSIVPSLPSGVVNAAAQQVNGPTSRGQNQGGGTAQDAFAAASSFSRGGMRGLGLVAAIIAEVALKEKVISLQKDYYRTNKRDYDFYNANHRVPMQGSISEAFGAQNPEYTPDLYASAASGMAKASIIDRQWFEARRRIPKYNIGQRKRLDYDMAVARIAGNVAGWTIGYTYEMNYADERNNRRFKRKLDIANVGINVGVAVRDGMARATSQLASSYDNLGDTIASIGNGYVAKSGYEAGKQYTRNRYAANQLPTSM